MIGKEEILESGSVEAHVLAASSFEDAQWIDSFVSSDEDVRLVLAEANRVMEDLALHQAVKPDEGLKDKIKSKLEFKKVMDNSPSIENKFSNWRYWAVAASLTIILSMSANIYLSRKVNSVEMDLQIAQKQTERLAAETGFVKEKQEESIRQLDLVLSENKRVITMNGQAFAPQAKATVYWVGNEVYLFTNNFPQNEEGVQYQLWAIDRGAPVDAGVFDVVAGNKGLIKLKNISNASAFAVTLEKKGGSPTPTLEKMMVLGTVGV
jgi:anti-sigma-K factor RskA